MPDTVKISKYLSYVLRHDPGSIGLNLDRGGWADIEELIRKSQIKMDINVIHTAVRTNNKQRFKISDDGVMIRANQGHSFEVDLGLDPKKPPVFLYHGTAKKNLESIQREGLKKMGRQYVHLSPDQQTAVKVGQRHGKPIVIMIDAKKMYYEGHTFYLSENGVWLTDHVPPQFLGHVIR